MKVDTGRLQPLDWELISSFVQSGVSKYVYAFPSFVFVLLTGGALSERVVNVFATTHMLSSYLFFSIIYSLVGLLSSVYCPREIKRYGSRDSYVATNKDNLSDTEIGNIKIRHSFPGNMSKLAVLERHYDNLNVSRPVLRGFISISLLLGVIPTTIGAVNRLIHAFG